MAILGSDTFDATTVDVTTLAFGPTGALPVHDLTAGDVLTEHTEDANLDGLIDLVSHYRCSETGIATGDTEACLTASTIGIDPNSNCFVTDNNRMGCDDQECQNTVCTDSFCCDVGWDFICAGAADDLCPKSLSLEGCDSVRTVPGGKN